MRSSPAARAWSAVVSRAVMIAETSVAGRRAVSWPMPSPRMRPVTWRRVRARVWRASQPASSRRRTSRRTRSRRSASPRPVQVGREGGVDALALVGGEVGGLGGDDLGAAFVEVAAFEGGERLGEVGEQGAGQAELAAALVGGLAAGQGDLGPVPASGLGRRRPGRGSSIRRASAWAWRCWSRSWARRAWVAQMADLRRSSSSSCSMTAWGSAARGRAIRVVRRAWTALRAPWRRPGVRVHGTVGHVSNLDKTTDNRPRTPAPGRRRGGQGRRPALRCAHGHARPAGNVRRTTSRGSPPATASVCPTTSKPAALEHRPRADKGHGGVHPSLRVDGVGLHAGAPCAAA